MTQKWIVAFMALWLGGSGLAQAQAKSEPTRGELLYATHCISCHNAQIHWRDQKMAKSWVSLKSEVHRWQGNSGLGWSEEDVTDVARYLNALYYRFPAPDLGRASAEDAMKLTHQ